MISKKDLLEGLDNLTEQVILQGELIKKLENEIKILKRKKTPLPQRDKTGKFIKKK